jgi:hypothetical protein
MVTSPIRHEVSAALGQVACIATSVFLVLISFAAIAGVNPAGSAAATQEDKTQVSVTAGSLYGKGHSRGEAGSQSQGSLGDSPASRQVLTTPA